MKRILCKILVIIFLLGILPAVNAHATQKERVVESLSEEPKVGLALLNVRIPDDFHHIVYVELTADDRDIQIYPIHSETNYMTEEKIPVGTYAVTGYLGKDLGLPYEVIVVDETVTVSADTSAFIDLSVVQTSDSTPEADRVTETIPDNTQTEEIDDTEAIDTEESSEEDNSEKSLILGNIVTVIVVFITVFCVIIFMGFVYRHQNE